ncbi:MAG TPA: cytochrome c biogenesis protein CcdA [Candidatus Limnocylindria bacterium]|nr:cytochrome c biogenesis protein CcdA [Candidatus Limnocylindria bacterium]
MSGVQLDLAVVVVAGLVDGINPCAIAVLLVFISATLLAVGGTMDGPLAGRRRALFRGGAAYVSGMFVTYLLLGLGLMGFASALRQDHLGTKIFAVVAIAWSLLALQEALLPELGERLRMPASLHGRAQRWVRRASLPGLFVAGSLIGLCTVPCSGNVYIAVLALLSSRSDLAQAIAYLFVYNLAFVLPLVALLVAAATPPAMRALARWQLHNRASLKLALGLTTALVSLAALATI